MDIQKYLNVNDIFNPSPSYEEKWHFALSNLIELSVNSKFSNFYEETFLKPLAKFFNKEFLSHIPMTITSKPHANLVGRKIVYSKEIFYHTLLDYFKQNIDYYKVGKEEHELKLEAFYEETITKSYNEINGTYAKLFKEKAQKIENILANEIESEYFDSASKDYASLKTEASFSTYFNNLLQELNTIYNGLLTLGDFLENELDIQKLAQCFKPDEFFLLFAKIILDYNLDLEKQGIKPNDSLNYLFLYNDVITKILQENNAYNPQIYINENGLRIPCSIWTIKDEILKLAKRYPKYHDLDLKKIPMLNLIQFYPENKQDFLDISLVKDLNALLNSENFNNNWDLITKNEEPPKSLDLKYYEIDERINILHRSHYLIILQGKNTFQTYYAYIYGIDTVIIEKFWLNNKEFIPAQNDATIITNLANFKDLNKLSTMTLNEYFKSLDTKDFKRIYHTSINRWYSQIFNAINGDSYSLNSIIKYIDKLRRDNMEQNDNE